MTATEPLPDDVWEQIGLRERSTFADNRHLVIYGQRTRDGRIAFGGRGAPYHYASKVSPAYERDERVHTMLRRILVELFPMLRDVEFTTAGVATSVCRVTGTQPCAMTDAPGSPSPVATSGTASQPPRWPAARSPR